MPTLFRWSWLAVFGIAVGAAVFFRAFPSLSGDEYNSLIGAGDLRLNLHAVGYFSQLKIWSWISGSDLWLRGLSLIWAAAGLWAFMKLGEKTELPRPVILNSGLLLAVNAFFLQYAFQVRFYALFAAASTLWFALLAGIVVRREKVNWVLLLFSALLLVSSHLFGWMVIAMGGILVFWFRCTRTTKIILLASIFILLALFYTKPVQDILTRLVYKTTLPLEQIPAAGPRGLTTAMIFKFPLTFFFFALGERVYPLSWISAAGVPIIGTAFILGCIRLRHFPFLSSIAVLCLASIAALFLIFDPLAPPSLQGAAARYVIYALPFFVMICALGAHERPVLCFLVWGITLFAFASFTKPFWSSSQIDLMDWEKQFRSDIVDPAKTCVVSDGRAQGAVTRYLPAGVRLADNPEACLGFDRVLIASANFDLKAIRYLDSQNAKLASDYQLVRNTNAFPNQLTVYEKKASKNLTLDFAPDRLGLPEQDLRFPLVIRNGRLLNGFVRLDEFRSAYEFQSVPKGKFRLLINYRELGLVTPGEPVAAVRWHSLDGTFTETPLRAGIETAAWDGHCGSCAEEAGWTKRLHLLGAQSYPGAYRQYRAGIWSVEMVSPSSAVKAELVKLHPNAVIYFWGNEPSSPEKTNA